MINVVCGWRKLTVFLAARMRAVGDERGASLVEYGLLLALIVIVCFVAMQFLGSSTSKSLSNAGSLIGP
jgi:pilus assembly protein Flp/PilA